MCSVSLDPSQSPPEAPRPRTEPGARRHVALGNGPVNPIHALFVFIPIQVYLATNILSFGFEDDEVFVQYGASYGDS